jgi:hypothetical protein
VSIGLDSADKNKCALIVILGLKKDLLQSFHQAQFLSSTEACTNATEALITSARIYALDTKASETNASLVVQVHIFRELVFASLCVVIEQQGLPRSMT